MPSMGCEVFIKKQVSFRSIAMVAGVLDGLDQLDARERDYHGITAPIRNEEIDAILVIPMRGHRYRGRLFQPVAVVRESVDDAGYFHHKIVGFVLVSSGKRWRAKFSRRTESPSESRRGWPFPFREPQSRPTLFG